MERIINRSQQGDLGEASAIDWLTRQGATVFAPLGHSPDADLIAELNGVLLRIQVKTTTQVTTTPDGHVRFPVMIATCGGNQSWSGTTKKFDPTRFDFLFVVAGNGRRWFMPAGEIKARRSVQLGSPRYSEFEIEETAPIESLVYGSSGGVLECSPLGEYPSGQRMAAVNRPAQPSQVRLLPPPSEHRTKRVGRGPAGTTCVGPSRKITLPVNVLDRASVGIGDRLRVCALRDGTILLIRAVLPDPKC